ncbi:MAG: hypothetical protein KBS43_02940 [Oscillospiraceae bacterium]|nr:hypothetical protein [Candidatus Limimonas coprohippi]MCQ2488089.1 hypothetical protein [Clostridia bacterium]
MSKIYLPRFDYMCQKNTYVGSVGTFRYRLSPLKKDDIENVFLASFYHNNCYEVELEAGRVTEKEFEYSQEGIDAAEAWFVLQLGD